MSALVSFTDQQLRAICRAAFDNGYVAGYEDYLREDGPSFSRQSNATAWENSVTHERMEAMIRAYTDWGNERHRHVTRIEGGDDCALCGRNFRDEIHFRAGEQK